MHKALKLETMWSYVCSLFILSCVLAHTEAKTYEKCELARALLKYPLFSAKLDDWYCLIEHESRFNTQAKQGPNTDDSFDWGLFQINDRYWCSASGQPGKECNISCQSLQEGDGIANAATCVDKIHANMGLDAWVAWRNFCKDKPKANIRSDCKL